MRMIPKTVTDYLFTVLQCPTVVNYPLLVVEMLSNGQVPDPTDWIGTPLASLSSLESALQCHVCKELFETPMITSCSHTFCSLCIRRCLSQDGKCPACRSGDQESKLRRNWAMEECVTVYQKQRDDLLTLARKIGKAATGKATDGYESEGRPTKRRRIQQNNRTNTTSEIPMRATRSQSRIASKTSQETREWSIVEDSEDDGSQYLDEDTRSQPDRPSAEPDDGLVACPVCHTRMKMEAVFTHLDQCDSPSRKQKHPTTPRQQQPTSIAYSVPSPTKTRQRLGALNYSLLTETALRKKLAEIGIPSLGPKQLMQRRHMEWMNLWNASCDSRHPKTKRELIRELDLWERTQGRHMASNQAPSGGGGVMSKDFDAEAWTQSNRDDFAHLITKARGKAPPPRQRPVESRDEPPGLNDATMPARGQEDAENGPAHHASTRHLVVDLTTAAAAAAVKPSQQNQGSQLNGVIA